MCVVVDPVTGAAVLGLINAVFKFATTGLETYQARVTAKTQERAPMDSQAAEARRQQEDRQLARELYIQARWDKVEADGRAVENAVKIARSTTELHNYPIRSGPGALRRNIALLAENGPLPLVVLFVPVHEVSDPDWHSLPRRFQDALMAMQDLELLALITDRWLSWPDASLVHHDLYDVPTVVVSAEVITGRLVLRLGGCNLGGDETVRPLRQILWLPLPGAMYWTETRLAALESTSSNHFQRPLADSPLFERELQLEWATRLAMVGIITAVDAYNLLRRRGYREHLDDVVGVFQSELELANAEIPLDALADPAYHLMHQAKRQLAAGAVDAARTSVAQALQILAAAPEVSSREAVLAARSARRLESWHEAMLNELAGAAQGRRVVPSSALAALRQPPSQPVASGARPPIPAGHSNEPPAAGQIAGDPARTRRWVGRQVAEIRQTPADARPRLSRGRPVSETRNGPAEPPKNEG